MNPLQPELSLLIKLGSLAIHVEELLSSKGHQFDKIAIEQILSDAQVKEWIRAMDKQAFLPVKR